MGLSFAHFINPIGGPEAIAMYRKRFKPSDDMPNEHASVAIFVFCSEDKEKLKQHQAMMDYRFYQFEKRGNLSPVDYEDIKDMEYSFEEQERIKYNRQRVIIGTPGELKLKLKWLAEDYKVDEIIAVTITERFEDRLTSYKLLAEQFELEKED